MAASDSQQAILDAVQSVIVRDGVRGASMRQVAQEADVSLGLLSYHFDDKDSLIEAAFERATTDLLQASVEAAAAVDDAEAKVRAFLRGSFSEDFLDGDYLRLRISLWAVAITDEKIAGIDARFYTEYVEELANLVSIARPDLSSAEVSARTADLIAFSNGLWLDWARFQNADALERGLAACEAIALDA